MLQRTKPPKNSSQSGSTDNPCSAYDQTVLVLQGGGALGSYQGGAFEVLHEAGIRPDWVAGISIGAVNAALIVGNPPEHRVSALKSFWSAISTAAPTSFLMGFNPFFDAGLQQLNGFNSMMGGVPGMFRPWGVMPWLQPFVSDSAVSFYDTSPLKQTLLNHVDFDRINSGEVRLSLGAVNVKTGNFVYFDTHEAQGAHQTRIGPEHVLASGALPPGFAAVEIDGESYWDGGIVSNTPLSYVLDSGASQDRLVFQIDLFSATGPVPVSIDEVQERMKDIGYSSRTRLGTDEFVEKYRLRRAVTNLIDALPVKDKAMAVKNLGGLILHEGLVSIVHLINRGNRREIQSKDYDFSQAAMNAHWRDGAHDAGVAMSHDTWRHLPDPSQGLAIYDYAKEDQDFES